MARLKRHRDRIIDPMGRRRLTRNEKIGIGSLATLVGVAALGVIAGVVLSAEDGPLAVRTRAGITFAPSDYDTGAVAHVGVPEERLQVCLVGRTASRFGRVELLDTAPAVPPRPTCTGSRRQVRDGLHDARQQALEGWRCGKVHGYPPLGQ